MELICKNIAKMNVKKDLSSEELSRSLCRQILHSQMLFRKLALTELSQKLTVASATTKVTNSARFKSAVINAASLL